MMKGTLHIAICACLICVFIVADLISGVFGQSTKVIQCLLDTACHATIAALIWLATINLGKRNGIRFEDISMSTLRSVSNIFQICRPYKEVSVSLILGSLVDIDHFIAAGSVSLVSATNLQSRPFGHTILAGLLLSLAVMGVSLFHHVIQHGRLVLNKDSLVWYRSKRHALLVFSAYLAHLLRDSVRRGLWVCTVPGHFTTSGSSYMVSSSPLHIWVVLTIYCILPGMNQIILNYWKAQVKLAEDDESNDIESGTGKSEYKLTV